MQQADGRQLILALLFFRRKNCLNSHATFPENERNVSLFTMDNPRLCSTDFISMLDVNKDNKITKIKNSSNEFDDIIGR